MFRILSTGLMVPSLEELSHSLTIFPSTSLLQEEELMVAGE